MGTVPANVAAGVLRRLAGALIGAAMLVTIVGVAGPAWGGAVALGWFSTGVLMLIRAGERMTARTLLRYRPAIGTWLAGEVARLAPGRQIDVYVAPAALGVFAVGGYTVAIGQRSASSVSTAATSSNQRQRGMPWRTDLQCSQVDVQVPGPRFLGQQAPDAPGGSPPQPIGRGGE